jgi:hypothetical protein
MSTGIEALAERPVVPAVIIRESYTSGCIGRIVDLHARYYSQASGFGLTFEAKVARELAQFCERLQCGRDGIWLLECDGQVQGRVWHEQLGQQWGVSVQEQRFERIGRPAAAAL